MDQALSEPEPSVLLEAWRQRCSMLLQRIELSHNGKTFHGHAIDLDPSAGLIIRTDTGNIVHLPAATTTIAPTVDESGIAALVRESMWYPEYPKLEIA